MRSSDDWSMIIPLEDLQRLQNIINDYQRLCDEMRVLNGRVEHLHSVLYALADRIPK